MVERVSIDDFDWSGSSSADAGTTPPLPADEPAPLRPPAPVDTPEPQRGGGVYGLDESKLPRAYIEYGRKNIYKRQQRPRSTPMSIDDVDWSGTGAGEPRTGGPAYNPADDYALTRGLKVGEQGGRQSMMSAIELGRIATLSPDEQRKAMIAHSNRARDPSEVQLQVPGIEDIPGEGILDTAGNALTFLGESGGQMLGSMIAAGEVGGLPGAVVGGGLGAAAGATALGAGALPGAGVGAVAGFTSGSLAAYGGMGVGGLFDDLMGDEGVKKGLADGSIDTDSLIKLTVGAGLAIGALDALPAGKAVSRVGGKEVAKDAVKLLLRKAIIKGALRGAKEEGTTEAVQGAISEVAQAYEGGDVNAAERALSVLNQGLVGAIGGAGPGVAGGVSENRQIPKPDDSLNQEFEIDYKTGAVKPSTRAAPTLPAGGGAPPASAAPHAPAGGFGQVPPQPAGAGARRTRAPVAPATVVQPGSVSPDIQAAATAASGAPPAEGQSVAAEPTAPQPAPRQGTGDITIDAALTPTPAQRPAPAAAPEAAVAPPPQVPEAPPSTAYQPTPPENIAPTNVDMLQGLPNYGPELAAVPQAPPPAAVQPPPTPAAVAPAATAPAPALVEEPVAPPAEPPLDLVSPRLTEDRRMLLSEHAGTLDVQDGTDRNEAVVFLRQLANNPEERDYFYGQLSREMRAWLDRQQWRLKAPQAPQEAPPAPVAAPAGVPAPRKSFKRPAPVVVKPRTPAPTLPVAKPTVAKVTVRVTPELHQRLAAKGEEAAEARLVRTTVRHPKTRRRLGQVVDIVRREKTDVKTGAKTEERLFKLSFKKEPVSLEDLLTKYVVETTTEQERLPQTFARPGRGYRTPPTPTPVADREAPKKPSTYERFALKPRPTPKAAEAMRRAERREAAYEAEQEQVERHAAPPVTRVPPKTAPLQQEVELELAGRLRRLEREAGVLEPIVHLADVLKATEQAIGRIKATKMPPFALLRTRFEKTINEAIAQYKAGKLDEEQVVKKQLTALARRTKWFETYRRYQAKLATRTTAGRARAAEALAAEDPKTWRVKAYAAEKAKRAGKPYDKLVFKMAQHFHTLAQFQKYRDAKSVARKEKARDKIAEIQAQRVAAAKAADAAQLKIDQETARAEARAMRAAETQDQRETTRYLRQLVESGDLEQGLAELLAERENRDFVKKFQERAERAVKTTPVLTRVIKTEALPEIADLPVARYDPAKAKRRRFTRAERLAQQAFRSSLRAKVVTYVHPERTSMQHPVAIKKLPEGYLRQSRDWAYDFVKQAKASLAKAKVQLPTRINRWFNTPEENGLIFIARLLATQPGRVRAAAPTAEALAEFEKRKGLGLADKRGASKNVAAAKIGEPERTPLARVANIHDAIVVMTLLKDLVNARTPQARKIAEDELNGAMFDKWREVQMTPAAEAAAAAIESEELTPAAAAEELAAEDEARLQARLERERSEYMEAKLRTARLFEEKGYKVIRGGRERIIESPIILPEGPVSGGAMAGRPMGVPLESMTGAEALNRFTAKWRVLEGAPRGWRRWVRASLIRSLRQLVGDIDVHVVDGIYANNKAGLFVPGAKPKILINRAAMDRPALLADTIIHEMAHAATNYALHNNLRGTRDIVEALMRQLRSQIGNDISSLSTEIQNAFKNVDEFVAAGIEHAPFQDMLASLAPTSALRAQVRALGRGRAMPNFWDQFVAMVENAIGFFTPAGTGGSYMSQLLKIYPNIAMTLAEQQRDTGVTPDANDILEHPFDMANIKKVVNNTLASARVPGATSRFIRRNLPTEELRRVIAEKYFDGNFDNPTKPLIDMLLKHARMIEDAMAPGDRQDAVIRDWVNQDRRVREPLAAKAYETVADATAEDVDPRKELKDNTWIRDDTLHPSKRRKKPTLAHKKATAKRKTHERLRADWLALPTELQDLMSKRLDHMSAQMQIYEHNFSRNMLRMWMDKDNISPVTLPKGLTFDQAVQQIMNGTITPSLEKALGNNADTAKGMGKLTRKGRLYAPLFRAGEHYISGRRNIATPAGATQKTDDRGHFQFFFDDEAKMLDYLERIGDSGDERFVGSPQKIKTKVGRKEVTRWRVTMQDRFMAMSDSPAELLDMKTEMMASGDYVSVSDPATMAQMATASSGMPLNLQKMIDNLNSMSGHSAAEKAVMQEMIRNMFVQTQQGNRITKKLLRRKGVHGYQTGFDDMTTAFRTNNEMMSRHIVALDRMPVVKKATSYLRKFVDAVARRTPDALGKLEPTDAARISRGYGKDDSMAAIDFGSDVKAITDRIEAAMKPQGKPFAEAQWNSFIGVVTMNYLMSPMYYALQTAGVALQTYPRMIAEVARDGTSVATAVQRASKLLYDAGTEVSFLGNYHRGVTEALMEGKHFAKGFMPRQDWLKHGRSLPRGHNYMEELYTTMRANGVANVEAKIAMLEEARLMNFIGQAGLDQPNLRLDTQKPGLPNKFMRGIEQSARIFRALQEGIEINNRAVPMIAYFNHFMTQPGMTTERASALAINKMVSEQTGYSKENWPGWVSQNKFISSAVMFKKFAANQAINFYDSLMRSIPGIESDPEARRYARIHLASMTLMLAAVGGFSGNPLWEPLRMLNYLLSMFGLNFMPSNYNEAKTEGEKLLASIAGDDIAEDLMYGAPRAIGIDLSNRVSLDTLLFYQQPDDMTKDDWYKVFGQFAIGAPGTTLVDTAAAIGEVTNPDKTWPKWLATLPIPKMMKDALKAYEIMEHGPSTATGVSTGPPTGLVSALLQTAGVRTREQARPFEQGSAAQHRAEQATQDERSALMRSISNSPYTSATARQLRDWNRSHPGRKERITMKNLHDARGRRRKLELEIRQKNLESM